MTREHIVEHAADGLTIQQVARLTGLAETTLRYYEQIGLIDPVERDPSSRHRRYSQTQVTRIESLAHLRAAGLPIEDMRTLMHSRGHSPETAEVKVGLLAAHRQTLSKEIAALQARRRYIDNRIAYWRAVIDDDGATAARLTVEGKALGETLS